MTTDTVGGRLVGAALLGFAGTLAAAASVAAAPATSSFETQLRPMPVDDETKAVIAGQGEATATFDGRTLSVTGRFEGLPSNATEALLMQSPYTAVPGKKIGSLTVTKATSGEVTGSVRLTREQAAALQANNLYLQINSEKAPPGYLWGPYGTVWGWFLPPQPKIVVGQPQTGEFYVPRITSAAR